MAFICQELMVHGWSIIKLLNLKGIIYTKINICRKCTHLQVIQGVDERV